MGRGCPLCRGQNTNQQVTSETCHHLRCKIAAELKPLSLQIDLAFIFGSIASGEAHNASDVDVMLIGEVGLADVAPVIRKLENKLNRSIQPVVMRRDEALKSLYSGNHFLHTVASSEKIFLVKRDSELESAFSSQTTDHTTSKMK